MSQDTSPSNPAQFITRILKVGKDNMGKFKDGPEVERLSCWEVPTDADDPSIKALQEAASYLRTADIPVGFPTETVYGLGADATRSASVKGIYTAKGRPSDNPLIVHVSDLDMLRGFLKSKDAAVANGIANGDHHRDVIPDIYKPLIDRFWPGPLTILLPNPVPSKLAPEVTAGLQNFGARMPSSPLALSLIKLTGKPLAAPSANASTRPSATSASDVLEDMNGRVELILDGGSCQVGVESTVVDGLCDPPVVLRPGGVSMEEIRSCPGWERVEKAYKDQSEMGKTAPRAPGMKYKHYSPRARVVLYEPSYRPDEHKISQEDYDTLIREPEFVSTEAGRSGTIKVGVIRTRHWSPGFGLDRQMNGVPDHNLPIRESWTDVEVDVHESTINDAKSGVAIGAMFEVGLGKDAKSIAQGLFSALRELDRRKVGVIFVEGIPDEEDLAAAVMNRLRKAASEIRS